MKSLRLGLFQRKPGARGSNAGARARNVRDKETTSPGSPQGFESASDGAGNYNGVQDGGRAAGATGTGVNASGPAATGASQAGANGGGNPGQEGRSRTDDTNLAPGPLSSVPGVRNLPRPALRWVGAAGRIAVREFDFDADAEAVASFQEDTYTLNFPDFRYNHSFATAFRHDLRRASLDPQHALFVLDEGEIVGFLWLVICQNTWTGERYGYVNNLYIAHHRRSQGLGNELMQQADTFFRSRRIKRVRLTVTAANASAVRLYANCGYETTRWEMEKDL